MTISLYEASVGVFVPYLGNLSELLDRASAYAKARNIDPAVLLDMRLYPNMYNLTRQVGEANRHAVLACALLAGRRAAGISGRPSRTSPNSSRDIGGRDRVHADLQRAAIDGAADKEVVFTFRNGATRSFTGRSLLLTFSVPQFFFHVTTAYDILRHAASISSRRIFWDRQGLKFKAVTF